MTNVIKIGSIIVACVVLVMLAFAGAASADSGFPAGYTEVEYIQSSGSQWINTGVISKSGLKYELVLSTTSSTKPYFGTVHQNDGSGCWFGWCDQFWGASYNSGGYSYTFSGNTDYTIEETYGGSLLINGNTVKTFSGSGSTSGPFYLFGTYDIKAKSLCCAGVYKVKSLKMYESGTLVRNFIPCIRDSDGAIGMYDTVEGRFYGNAGTGTFIAGNKLLPDEYTRVEYIQSSGTQYIDTGIVPTINTNFELKHLYQSASGNINYLSGGPSWGGNQLSYWVTPSDKKFQIKAGPTSAFTWISTYSPSANDIITAKLTGTTFSVSGTNGAKSTTVTRTTLGLIDNITLFAYGGSTVHSCEASTIYSCKFYDGSTLVRNFIPCIRDSDNAVGMYDSVTKTFYGNSGTGTFTAGPKAYYYSVTVDAPTNGTITVAPTKVKAGFPSGYTEVEYIQSSGTQHIDTGVACNQIYKLDYTLAFISGASVSGIFGNYENNKNVLYLNTNNGKLRLGHNGNVEYYFSSTATPIKTNVVYDYPNQKFTVDGVDLITSDLSIPSITSNFIACGKLMLNGGSSYQVSSSRHYGFKLYGANNILLRNFIPCVLTSDIPASKDSQNTARTSGTVGMWDTVTDKFYANVGSGVFVAGDFLVTVDNTLEHGTIAVTPTSGVNGAMINVTSKPDNGYHLNWTYWNASGFAVKNRITGGKFMLPLSNVNVSGDFLANVTSVTFTNGTASIVKLNTYGSATNETPSLDPHTGHTFMGWNVSDGGSWYNFNSVAYNNSGNWNYTGAHGGMLDVYANWTVNKTTITLDKNNGVENTSATATYGSSALDGFSNTTRVGYTLNGYTTALGSGDMVISADGQLLETVPGYTEDGKWMYENTPLTLYANWTENDKFTVTYDGNGNDYGAAPVDLASPYYVGSIVTILDGEDTFIKIGYNLTGWNMNSASGELKQVGQTFTIDADTVLYANWTVTKKDDVEPTDKNASVIEPLVPERTDAPIVILDRLENVTNPIHFVADSGTAGKPEIASTGCQNLDVYATFQLNKTNGETGMSKIVLDVVLNNEADKDHVYLKHYTEGVGWDAGHIAPVSKSQISGLTYQYTFETDKFSPFAVVYETQTPTPSYSSSSSKQTGYTTIMQEVPTTTPTVEPTVESTPAQATPTTQPTTQQTQSSPAPVVGIIAGLGAMVVILRLRK